MRRIATRAAITVGMILTLSSTFTVGGSVSASAAANEPCASYSYACTPGYSASNANGWPWARYGGSYALTPNGYHNCTLYAAWRLQQSGLNDPGPELGERS